MEITNAAIRKGDRVGFSTTAGLTFGTVFRVWGTRAVNISIKTDDGRTYVRLIQSVQLVSTEGRSA